MVSKNKECWDSVDTGVSKKQLSLEKEKLVAQRGIKCDAKTIVCRKEKVAEH